jgi:hypothetical protein
MKGLKAPLARLAQTHGVNACLMLHLSREGQALGRRVKGVTRTLMHPGCPDPEGQPDRLKFWVEKSYSRKPPALGATLGSDGDAYDFDPPRAPAPSKGGRPSNEPDKARLFIIGELTRENDRKAKALWAEWEEAGGNKNRFWDARHAMVAKGELTCEGKLLVLHLIGPLGDPPRGASY